MQLSKMSLKLYIKHLVFYIIISGIFSVTISWNPDEIG